MQNVINRAKAFITNEDGPTATEYAVMLALIIIAALTAITALGGRVSAIFSEVTTGIGGECMMLDRRDNSGGRPRPGFARLVRGIRLPPRTGRAGTTSG